MKQKISVTLDEETVFEIQNQLRTGKFRNKSHVVEYAVKRLLEDEVQNSINKNHSVEGHPLKFMEAHGSRIIESKLQLKNQKENGRNS